LRGAAPDETTILRFRHLLEQHDLCGEMLMTVNRYLETKGIRITTGTIVDATIIHAPVRRRTPVASATRDASDQEGQAVVLRRQGAHRRG